MKHAPMLIRRVAGSGLFVVMSLLGTIESRGATEPASASTTANSDAPQVISTEQVKQHIGKKCTVAMHVRSSRRGDTPICFLNSEFDFQDRRNFTVVLFEAGLAAFQKQGITDPARHFSDKQIRVTGVIEKYKGRPQMRVDDPAQIEIVPAAEKAGNAEVK